MEGSVLAKITNTLLKRNKPKYMCSEKEVIKFIKEKSTDQPKKIPNLFKNFDFNGKKVVKIGKLDKSKNIILYMHGGAYVGELNRQHLLYCYLLAHKCNAYVLAPVYPLAPNHNCCESYSFIKELYGEIIKKNYNKLILMGDSAGGGFILSFCQYLNKINLPQPDNIICFSPWVDISMSGQYGQLEKNDPILGEIGLKEIGKIWAGDLDVKDYKVSPVFGDCSNLAKTLLFVGTNELFYPDIKKFEENAKKSNVNIRVIEKKDLFHIYPLFPISEAKDALKEIKKEINDD